MSGPGEVILGDWGTSRLRLFRMRGEEIVDRADGPGIGALNGTPAAALVAAVAPWRGEGAMSVTLCGMVGSRNGLVEVPYAACPATLAEWREATLSLSIEGLDIMIAPGLKTRNWLGAPDVMRGEETQIFGAIAGDPALGRGRHLIVLPGTHSKWAAIVDGRVERFHTFPTGEFFALLRDHSTLARAGAREEGRDEGFDTGLARSAEFDGLLAAIFEARSAQLLDGRSHGWALGYLSGLLLGHEAGEGLRLLGDRPERILMIGDPGLTALYRRAFAARGIQTLDLDGNGCSIAGLIALQSSGKESH
ncbi:2-dehydro-3-deoxygalactonokinase [Sphingomonas oleivorans]|uniref:2-dehydro-3-deoxygalactonokinase n=1 Tax=Sphingomonas oleivorans TaxID=1735121 RepID=A0A2T5G1S6_9SPHN|nr:2-dehydro-3-deoxygalactonokinase [Sphingomonas oleivorans]PTQ13092.1 2-dehydro-3-deoxygalactonokinase [Sphingomonas oleivorans]